MKRSYARRPLRRLLDTGIRDVASTYGKRSFASFSDKAGGLVAPESHAELIVAHLLSIDPSVSSFKTQPFTVDIVDRRILRTREELSEARWRHRCRDGDVFYTPDFETTLVNRNSEALEVKLETFEGDGHYRVKLEEAASVLHGFGYRLRKLVMPANRTHPVYANAQVLRHVSQRHDLMLAPDALDAVDAAHEAGAVTLGDYSTALGLPANVMPLLIFRGYLAAELLKAPINWAMRARPANGDLEHLRLVGGLEP